MNDMTFAINHDVPIVAIFDLQYITDDRVSSHRLDEVEAGLLELHGIFSSVLRYKEVKEVVDFCPSHLVTRGRIRHNVDNSTLPMLSAMNHQVEGNGTYTGSRRSHAVWEYIEGETDAREDVLEHRDDLKGEDVLPAIIPNFEDGLLPDVVLLDLFLPLPVRFNDSLRAHALYQTFLADLEGSHKWGLHIPLHKRGEMFRKEADNTLA